VVRRDKAHVLAAIETIKAHYKAEKGAAAKKINEYALSIGQAEIVAGLESLTIMFLDLAARSRHTEPLAELYAAEEHIKGLPTTPPEE
jgi:hypothetical protein